MRRPARKYWSSWSQQAAVKHHQPSADATHQRSHGHVHAKSFCGRQRVFCTSRYCRMAWNESAPTQQRGYRQTHGFITIRHISWKTSAVCPVCMLTATGTWRPSRLQYTSGCTSCLCDALLSTSTFELGKTTLPNLQSQITIRFRRNEQSRYMVQVVLLLQVSG